MRNGDSVGRKSRRSRRTKEKQQADPSIIIDGRGIDLPNIDGGATDQDKTADLARDMLAALKSDGFEAFTPTSPKAPIRSSRRLRQRRVTEFGAALNPTSPNSSSDKELSETEDREKHSSGAENDLDDYTEHGDDPDVTVSGLC